MRALVAAVVMGATLAGCAAPAPAGDPLAIGETHFAVREASDELELVRVGGETDWTRGTIFAMADGLSVRREADEDEDAKPFDPLDREEQRLSRWFGASMRVGDALEFCSTQTDDEDAVIPEVRLDFELHDGGVASVSWTFRRVQACPLAVTPAEPS